VSEHPVPPPAWQQAQPYPAQPPRHPPVAWVIGARVRRVMAESPGRWSGDDLVTVGYVLGIIGTVLCVIGA